MNGLKPSVRVSGGTPAGFPDYKPLNPWGRPMPKYKPPEKPERYQIFVETKTRDLLAIGPKAPEDFLRPLCRAIEEQIARGNEKDWSNPHIVRLL